MKTPKFYYTSKGFLAFCLLPFSLVFLALSCIRNFFIKSVQMKDKIIICVGNATMGGAGKTPSCIFLAQILKEKGIDVCFASKGYGRKTKGFMKLEAFHNANEVGDEALLLKEIAPVYLFSKYKELLENSIQIKEKVIIMDDGMQNPTIQKDITFLIIDSKLQFGNGFLFPAGPLRQTINSAICQASAILKIGADDFALQIPKPIFTIEKKFTNIPKASEKFLAFSGLAINEKFFSTLEALNINVEKKIEFQDHHFYSSKEMEDILNIAQSLNLKIITTQKDIVKIDPEFLPHIQFLKMDFSSNQKDEVVKFIFNLVIFRRKYQ